MAVSILIIQLTLNILPRDTVVVNINLTLTMSANVPQYQHTTFFHVAGKYLDNSIVLKYTASRLRNKWFGNTLNIFDYPPFCANALGRNVFKQCYLLFDHLQ